MGGRKRLYPYWHEATDSSALHRVLWSGPIQSDLYSGSIELHSLLYIFFKFSIGWVLIVAVVSCDLRWKERWVNLPPHNGTRMSGIPFLVLGGSYKCFLCASFFWQWSWTLFSWNFVSGFLLETQWLFIDWSFGGWLRCQLFASTTHIWKTGLSRCFPLYVYIYIEREMHAHTFKAEL